MAKAKVKQRKDSKGRVLQKGESQRKSDGMYIYTYVDPYEKRCYCYSTDLFKLREKEQDLMRAQMDGLDYYVGGRATINMTFDRYMSTKYNLRQTTRSNYIYMYNRFVRDEFGEKLLTEVKYTDVKLFYYHLLNDKDIAINTLDNIHTVIHPIFDMAVRDDIIRKNPSDGVMAELKKNSGKNKGIRHALTLVQQKAFIDAIRYFPEYVHWYPIFVTLLGTGMRIGECIGLRWKDVDFKHRCISVNHAVTYYTREGKAGFGVSKPKTEAGVRSIPLMDTVYNTLQNEYERQKRDGFCIAEVDGMNGFIFSNKNGNLHNPHCLNLAITRVSETYNAKEIIDAKKEQREPVLIPHFSVHQLRHTFCSRLCENETNIKVIQEIMGHANVETTLDIYTEVNFNKKQDSLEELSHKIDFF
ncbi:Site-specific recombinase XerD [Anaerocolumna jejuensis DSM 15929]|uniref:Site-specific recombinase XerD n=1 Tax=Anaerocolumna jejuensis DSM 15929 TaxID=1121322 RepID=A0A1M6V8R2_9FIRM|nr:tyrosine-type recombinase/integrase [Anaerocolumna jejuensis]SHK77897.1 Site-specific recombinase XerD [Anaerocolumna jejuensis DSM 15929]